MNDVDTESLRLSGIFNLGGLIEVVKVNILFQDREFVNFPLQIFNIELGSLFRLCQWSAQNNFNISRSQGKLRR